MTLDPLLTHSKWNFMIRVDSALGGLWDTANSQSGGFVPLGEDRKVFSIAIIKKTELNGTLIPLVGERSPAFAGDREVTGAGPVVVQQLIRSGCIHGSARLSSILLDL